MVYTYDTWGNLATKKVYTYTTATNPGTPTSTITYSYGNSAWGDQLTSYNGQTITYDAMGNPTTYRGKTLTWRGKQLTQVSGTASYVYDSNGLRQRKTASGTNTDYCYNGSVLIGLTKGSDKLRFSYDAAGQVQAVNHNGTYYYYLRNGQGDIVKIIDSSGAAKVEYTYDSWGKKLSCTGTLATTLGVLNPFRYRGYVYDEETQWYYLKSRYYDPETCRFISADVLLSTGQGVLGHNCYTYCNNNPINFFDNDGEIPEWVKKLIKSVAATANEILHELEDKIDDIDLTYSSGIAISATPSAFAFSGTGCISVDTKGNIAIQYSLDGSIHTGTPSAAVSAYGSITNASSVDKLDGPYYIAGGSAAALVEGVPIYGGIDGLLLHDEKNDAYFYGLSQKIGTGVPGAEVHSGWGETWTIWRTNLFEEIDRIHKKIMEW